MSIFDVIKDTEGKEYLIFDSSELYDDNLIGDKLDDFEILQLLGKGTFGKVFKVKSKLNNKVYAMKMVDLKALKDKGQKYYDLTINEINFLIQFNNPHVIKYYKKFEVNNYSYIIIEFTENGDLKGLIKTYKSLNKHIPEEMLWNIFLQCMEGLCYIHQKNIIHRDIKPDNILIDNNMIIKIGDFGVSALIIENNNILLNLSQEQINKMLCHGTFVGTGPYMAKEILEYKEYNQKVDVFSMGVSFYEMVYFEIPKRDNQGKILINKDNNYNYSKELLDIIYLMLEEDKDKRKTSKQIYEMIENIYKNRFIKISCIETIIRCLFSFKSLTNNILNLNNFSNKPNTQAYANCLNSITKPSLDEWIDSIFYFRKVLGFQNPKIRGNKEIDPRYVFAFIIKQLHKELNNSQYINSNNNNNKHLILSGEELSKTSKVEMMIKYINDFLAKFNSIISNSFLGLMKLTNTCNTCKTKIYSFNSYFFVTFNLEIIRPNINEKLILENLFNIQNQTEKEIYCYKCLKKTSQISVKQFYSFPNLLVISIQRGASYQYKNSIDIKEQLDLTQFADFKIPTYRYQLIGVLKRKIKNGSESFISICYFNQKWWECEDSYVNETLTPSYFDPEGDTIMLFYERNYF